MRLRNLLWLLICLYGMALTSTISLYMFFKDWGLSFHLEFHRKLQMHPHAYIVFEDVMLWISSLFLSLFFLFAFALLVEGRSGRRVISFFQFCLCTAIVTTFSYHHSQNVFWRFWDTPVYCCLPGLFLSSIYLILDYILIPVRKGEKEEKKEK